MTNVLKGKFSNREDAKKERLKKLGKSIKIIKAPKEKINLESRSIKARDLINQLEYILFGFDNEEQT